MLRRLMTDQTVEVTLIVDGVDIGDDATTDRIVEGDLDDMLWTGQSGSVSATMFVPAGTGLAAYIDAARRISEVFPEAHTHPMTGSIRAWPAATAANAPTPD